MVERDQALGEAMAVLAELVDELGYGALYTSLAGTALFVPDRRAALGALDGLAAEERALLGLFALDLDVPEALWSPRLRRLAEALVAAGLAKAGGGALRGDDLVLVPVLGGLLLTATPPRWRPQAGRQRAYVGEDSLRLARSLPDLAGKVVADVGCGCGIQGLLAARSAQRVVLSDIEPRSVLLAECNRLLNGLGEDRQVVAGDGYRPLGGRRFDCIVALPPYLPAIGALGAAVAGGRDGLGLIRTLVAGAAEHLSPGGELVLLAQLLCDDDGPLLVRELDELAPGSEVRLLVSDWHPMRAYLGELADRLAAEQSLAPETLRAAGLVSLGARQVTGVCSALLRLRAPGAAAGAAGVGGATVGAAAMGGAAPGKAGVGGATVGASTTVRGFRPRSAEDVYAAREGLRFVEDRSLRSVLAPGAEPLVLPAPVAALLAAFEGGRSVQAAAAAAWGEPEGADPGDLLAQALVRVGELERAGLLDLRR